MSVTPTDKLTPDQIRVWCALVGCDTARILNPSGDRLFFIAGYYRHTKDDPGEIWINGERRDYAYTHEETVASGETVEALERSIYKYKRLQGMTMLDLLKQCIKHDHDCLKADC